MEEVAFVSMDGNAVGARSAEEVVFVSMGDTAECARGSCKFRRLEVERSGFGKE